MIPYESIGTGPLTGVGVLGGGTVRIVGAAAIGAVILGMLYVVVRHGESRSDGIDDDEGSGLPSLGPAYGAGGSTIEEALTGQRMDDGPPEQSSEADGDDPEEPRGPPEVLSHRIVSRREGELVVEVTDGDTTGRFYVEDPDANPTVSSASPGTDRLDDDWAETARDYLRASVLAGEFERDRPTE